MSKTARQVIAESSLGHDPMAMDHLLEALDDAGFVIVPKEPTKEMLDAGEKGAEQGEREDWHFDGDDEVRTVDMDLRQSANFAYRAMIAAAEARKAKAS